MRGGTPVVARHSGHTARRKAGLRRWTAIILCRRWGRTPRAGYIPYAKPLSVPFGGGRDRVTQPDPAAEVPHPCRRCAGACTGTLLHTRGAPSRRRATLHRHSLESCLRLRLSHHTAPFRPVPGSIYGASTYLPHRHWVGLLATLWNSEHGLVAPTAAHSLYRRIIPRSPPSPSPPPAFPEVVPYFLVSLGGEMRATGGELFCGTAPWASCSLWGCSFVLCFFDISP